MMLKRSLVLFFGLTMMSAMLLAQTDELVTERLVIENDPARGLPGIQFNYELHSGLAKDVPGPLAFRESSSIPFTGLAVGWQASEDSIDPHGFHIEVRSRDENGNWTDWVHTSGYYSPHESPSGLYWSHLYITEDGSAHDEFDIRFETPDGVSVDFLRISAADARSDETVDRRGGSQLQNNGNVFIPEIITRDEWWGDLPEDQLEPSYTPTQINITHAIVHHTVTQNNPPDPAQVVRQIWEWHVYDNGWLDIGYNFLVDQFGNIYQGRYNPWLNETDIRGAHAGNANSRSVGIAVLGQFHPGASPTPGHPDDRSLRSVEDLIAWRFVQRSLNPLEEADISSSWGTVTIPRISGHRDVMPTACPGDNLWVRLPEIRQNVFLSMDYDIFFVGAEGTAPLDMESDFLTLKAAVDSINTHEFTQDVFLYVTSDLTEDEDIALGVSTNGHSLIIKPYLDVTATIEFTNTAGGAGDAGDRPLIHDHFIIGASQPHEDYLTATHNVIIDGSNTDGGTSRDLTLLGAVTDDVKPVIRVIGNSTNVELKNLNIESRVTETALGQAAVNITNYNDNGTALAPDNIVILNNDIIAPSTIGILFWHYDFPETGIQGAQVVGNDITASHRGINALYLEELTVRENTFNMLAGPNETIGIFLGYAVETENSTFDIARNEFTSLASSGSPGLVAIDLVLGDNATVNVYNNLISGIQLEQDATDMFVYGIRHAAYGDATSHIYYNTVHISELNAITESSIAAFAFERGDGTAPEGTAHLQNNIFYVDETSMPVYGIRRAGTGGVLYSDVNNIFVHENGFTGYYDDADAATLEDWQTVSGGDSMSVAVPVEFQSETNPRLTGSSIGDRNLAAVPIEWIATDIDGRTRSSELPLMPYMGGHEPVVPIVQIQSIAEARQSPAGSHISVIGIITRVRGGQLAIQDETAGLVIRVFTGPLADAIQNEEVHMGDELWVQGTLSETNQLQRIAPGDLELFDIISKGNPVPDPLELTLEQMIAEGSSLQGTLIKVTDVSIDDLGHTDFSRGTFYPLTDPSESEGAVALRVASSAETEIIGEEIPQQPLTIMGTFMQHHPTDPDAGYQILAVLKSDIDALVGVDDETRPLTFKLHQNYPNPFNPSTTIQYTIPEQSNVKIEIFNALGQRVNIIVNGELRQAGHHEVVWEGVDMNGRTVSSGMYMYRITAGEFIDTKRMMFLK